MKILPRGSIVLYVPWECDYRSGIECDIDCNFILPNDYAREVDWGHVTKYKMYNCGVMVSTQASGFHIYFQSHDIINRG